jgi:CSLREA domain-containing protein
MKTISSSHRAESSRVRQLLAHDFELLENRLLFATITVTTAADTLKANDGVVSLREAITATNANSSLGDSDISGQNPGSYGSADQIRFNIAGSGIRTINVGSSGKGRLPTITDGVTINGYTQPGASPNTKANSDDATILIELNGANAGNAADGIDVHIPGGGSATKHAVIRGLAINRFSLNGIHIQSNYNVVTGNFVGTNPQGTVAQPNQNDGIRIAYASHNTIGGTSSGDRNLSSGNTIDGIHVVGDLAHPSTSNVIQGNFVGVNAAGTGSVGNRPGAPAPGTAQGNSFFGIEISGGNNNLIGGTSSGARNVVGLNGAGIEIDNGGQGNIIQGNYSGVGADGHTPVGNLLHGVVLRSDGNLPAPLGPGQPHEPGVKHNLVGGTTAGAGNLIEFNGTGGVAVFKNPLNASFQNNDGNAILGNSIYLNGRSDPHTLLGIDLVTGPTFPADDGITPNDSGDADMGPNQTQNFPVLASATRSGSSTVVIGSLSTKANQTYRIEFFASDPDPAGGIAEGQHFIGFKNVTTNSSGKANFTATLAFAAGSNQVVTATATSPGQHTSEFSAAVHLTPSTTLAINNIKQDEGDSGTRNFVFTVTRAGNTSGTTTVHFATASGTAISSGDFNKTSGTLTFASGQLTRTITVQVRSDTKVEGDETFVVNLSNAVGASIVDAQGIATIDNDD